MKHPTWRVVREHTLSDEPDEVFELYTDLMLDEADVLHKNTVGQYSWREWLAAIDNKEPDALRFLYWLCRKRAGNPIDGNFSDITFFVHELTFTYVDYGDFKLEGDDDEPIELTGADPIEGVATVSS